MQKGFVGSAVESVSRTDSTTSFSSTFEKCAADGGAVEAMSTDDAIKTKKSIDHMIEENAE